MQLNQRIEYSSIVDRPRLALPQDASVIVWPIVVLETWDITRPMPRQAVPTPAGHPVPDYANWSWHEYEMRTGFWRLKSALETHGIVPSVSINSTVCESHPHVASVCRDAGWEFIAHGVTQRPAHEAVDEAAMIVESIEAITRFTGRRPRGWASPGLVQTEATLDHLTAAGLEYVCDFVLDDQPCEIQTKHGPIVGLPYSVDFNDVPAIVVQRQTPDEFRRSICDAFDRLYAEASASASARIITIVLHPYVCAASHRIRYIEDVILHLNRPGVLFWTGAQILDWYRSVHPVR